MTTGIFLRVRLEELKRAGIVDVTGAMAKARRLHLLKYQDRIEIWGRYEDNSEDLIKLVDDPIMVHRLKALF